MAKTAKPKEIYICSECGYETPKWMGKCPMCGEWNSFSAVAPLTSSAAPFARSKAASARPAEVASIRSDLSDGDAIRYHTGLSELDRVLGGGLVKGSLVLLGGDPGIGKSTLLLQISQALAENLKVLYVSGEESAGQLHLRARHGI